MAISSMLILALLLEFKLRTLWLYEGNPEYAQIHEKWDVAGGCKNGRCLHLSKFWISKFHSHL